MDDEQTIIDDSRNFKQTMELIVGKKFKYEPWEECLKSMSKNEISSFTVDKKVGSRGCSLGYYKYHLMAERASKSGRLFDYDGI